MSLLKHTIPEHSLSFHTFQIIHTVTFMPIFVAQDTCISLSSNIFA